MKRMFDRVKKAGKYISIHSCGDVHELFDDLICIGLNIANPFQPEAMDVHGLMKRYKGKLAFHGGLSTQQTLPYGTVDEVVAETKKLLKAGCKGGYIFAPAHGVGGEVPVENISAIVELLHSQPGFKARNP
jgi:uroporphyrinogen decarboxylase